MSDLITECEKYLCTLLGRKFCILTGRGSTALWLAYSLTDQKRSKILLPAIICLSPMLNVYYAERVPLFADVQIEDSTLDPCEVEKMLDLHPEIGAVLAVHLYGHPAAMEDLSAICSKHGVLLIEDLAQAFGGKDDKDNLFGSKGDIAIISFGHSKIIDVGGGGAFLTDDKRLAEKARYLNTSLSYQSSDHVVLSDCYRKLYYAIWECGNSNSRFFRFFDLFPELFKSLYLFRIDKGQAKKIYDSLPSLDFEVSRRIEVAKLYRNMLEGVPGITFFTPSAQGIPWRFTFRVKCDIRDYLLKHIRKAGHDISSWYPSITEWAPTGRFQGREMFPIANILEKEVVNLWVTEDYETVKAKEIAIYIKEILKAA